MGLWAGLSLGLMLIGVALVLTWHFCEPAAPWSATEVAWGPTISGWRRMNGRIWMCCRSWCLAIAYGLRAADAATAYRRTGRDAAGRSQRHDAAARGRSRIRPVGSARPTSRPTPRPSTRQGRPGLHRGHRAVRGRGGQVRRRRVAGRPPATAQSAEALPRAGDAGQSGAGGGAHDACPRRSRRRYGRGKWCKDPARPATCLDIEADHGAARDVEERAGIREAWEGWHTVWRADAPRLSALHRPGQHRARRNWVSPTPVRCGA